MNCKNCDGYIISTNIETLCGDCGLVSEKIISNYQYIDTQPISKMIYTNQEKSNYVLKKFIIELCKDLEIPEQLLNHIINLSVKVLKSIATYYNVKRSNVKTGIILVCIENISEYYSAYKLSKQIDLDIKHVSRAYEFTNTLLISKKLCLN